MPVTARPFGTLADGTAVTAYRLENGRGVWAVVLDYGVTIQSVCVPGRDGTVVDVVLGYETAGEYEKNGGYLGATIGRVGNRIGGARFSLNGKVYQLAKNKGENHIHGGVRGFDKYVWDAEIQGDSVVFSRLSPDGEEGYPGNLRVQIRYTLTPDNVLRIAYDADTDQDTLVNLTNHTYFNLSGGGTILNHRMRVFAERFCENGEGGLPTGKLLWVEGTPFDFRTEKAIGADIEQDHPQLKIAGGYDHNYVLSGKRAAEAYSPETGVEMTVETDLPGMQVYTANGLKPRPGKWDMGIRTAVCFETQLFPNAMNCYGFPSPVLRAGQHLHTETAYGFRVR